MPTENDDNDPGNIYVFRRSTNVMLTAFRSDNLLQDDTALEGSERPLCR